MSAVSQRVARGGGLRGTEARSSTMARVKLIAAIAVSVFIVAIPSFVSNLLILQLLIHIAILSLLSLGLNLVFGFTGQISIGHAGFYALGAYSAAILETKVDLPWYAAWPLGIVITMVLAWLLSFPILRLRGHYLAMGTLAFGLIVFTLILNWIPVTGGSDGIILPARTILGPELAIRLPYIVLGSAVLAYWGLRNLVSASVGRALRALRDDEDGADALGIPVRRYKTIAFVIAAGLAAVAGILFAHHTQVITPETFAFNMSIQILLMVVIGGMASNIGAIIGAALVVVLPHYLQAFEQYQSLIWAALVLVILLFEPRGVVGLGDQVVNRRSRRASLAGRGSSHAG
jgi:branched-chain amino acid transport system permease protein